MKVRYTNRTEKLRTKAQFTLPKTIKKYMWVSLSMHVFNMLG
jgi:hypothetical protein